MKGTVCLASQVVSDTVSEENSALHFKHARLVISVTEVGKGSSLFQEKERGAVFFILFLRLVFHHPEKED